MKHPEPMNRRIVAAALAMGVLTAGGCGPTAYKITPVPVDRKLEEAVLIDEGGWAPAKVVLIDVDGMLLNRRQCQLLGEGEHIVSLFVEKLDKARADVEKRIANLPSRQALSQARDRLARDQKEAEKALAALEEREKRLLQSSTPAQAEPQAPYEPAEGDWVTVGKGDQAGRIEKINTSRGQATILIGGLQVTTKIGHLRRAKSPETDVPQRDSGSLYTGGTPAETVPAEIELIGKRVADALDELDRYLDRATLSHHTKVRVVHGYGTGALRSGIHEFLAQHPHAESFRLAPDKEGGGAVTLVHLR